MSVTDEETALVDRLKKLPLALAGGFIFITGYIPKLPWLFDGAY